MFIALIFTTCLIPALKADLLAKYKALNFPGDAQSFITFVPDAEKFAKDFSFCGWYKPHVPGEGLAGRGSWPIFVSYGGNELRVQVDGGFNCIFGTCMHLKNKFPSWHGDTWHHYCATWSARSRHFREFVGGEEVSQRATVPGRRLQTGLHMTLGNWGQGGLEGLQFHGIMFNVNVLPRELAPWEVASMAEDRCAVSEEEGGISWEDIVGKPRNGTISEIDTGCSDVELLQEKLERVKNEVVDSIHRASQAKDDLNKTLRELEIPSLDTGKIEHAMELNNATVLIKLISSLNHQKEKLNEVTLLVRAAKKMIKEEIRNENETSREKCESVWDVLYSDMFYNKIFTADLAEILSNKWDRVSDRLVGMRISKELIELMKQLDDL